VRRISEIAEAITDQRYLWSKDEMESGKNPVEGRLPFYTRLEAILKLSGAEGVEGAR